MVQLIGARIQQLREEAGLDPAQLAYKAGVHVSTVHKIEAGERPNTSAVIIGQIASALHTTTDYLIGRTNDSGPLMAPAGTSPQVRRAVAEMLEIWSELEQIAPDVLDRVVLQLTSQAQLMTALAEADERRQDWAGRAKDKLAQYREQERRTNPQQHHSNSKEGDGGD